MWTFCNFLLVHNKHYFEFAPFVLKLYSSCKKCINSGILCMTFFCAVYCTVYCTFFSGLTLLFIHICVVYLGCLFVLFIWVVDSSMHSTIYIFTADNFSSIYKFFSRLVANAPLDNFTSIGVGIISKAGLATFFNVVTCDIRHNGVSVQYLALRCHNVFSRKPIVAT